MNLRQSIYLFGYSVLFLASVAVMIWWQKRQRKARQPFGEDIRLLRSPGESQLKHVLKFDEDAFLWVVMAGSTPVLIGLLAVMATSRLPATLQWAGLAVSAVLFVVTFILSGGWFAGKTSESHNRYLGYFGERIVAEHLDSLKARGWRLFHDVPATEGGRHFNLDHIAVGPTGVFVIETKTRRKGRARPGFEEHKVYFDGHALVWPWGEDNHGLDQAEHNAAWLGTMLRNELGEAVPVTAFLTLPGWMVEMKPAQNPRLCRVTNTKGLDQALPAGPVVLTPEKITAIAEKLELRCRDVAY